MLTEHKGICLKINGKRTVRLKKGFIEFKNYSKQTHAPFKIHGDSECIFKNCEKQ